MKVPFVDLSLQWNELRVTLLPELEALFEASAFSAGPWVARFEEAIAAYLEVPHAVAVNSGTSALHLAVITAGLRPGDRVLVPSHTFIGTVWGLIYHGAVPLLCDVDPCTGTIDVANAAPRITPDVKAIIPVHLYGQPADMDAVLRFARQHGLTVIEDCAQAIGARYGSQCVGSLGTFGCFSFYPGKNLGAAGEAGLITCADPALAANLRMLRDHGQRERYLHERVGFNYRMDGIQALVLRQKLARLDAWTAERRRLATRYLEALRDCPVHLPQNTNGGHVWHLFVIRAARRDALRRYLTEAGIETGLHYPVPLHQQPCLMPYVMPQDVFPVADEFAAQALSLPLFPGMTEVQQDHVIDRIRAFFAPPRRTVAMENAGAQV